MLNKILLFSTTWLYHSKPTYNFEFYQKVLGKRHLSRILVIDFYHKNLKPFLKIYWERNKKTE